jgi:hypothetical protein
LETEPKKIKTLLGHDWRINLSALSGWIRDLILNWEGFFGKSSKIMIFEFEKKESKWTKGISSELGGVQPS